MLAAMIVMPVVCFSQTPAVTASAEVRSSPAYAEVLLRRTELRADLEAVLADYTEENPKVIDLRFELDNLEKALNRIAVVKPTETGKLTLALGKMLVKKAGLETDLTRLMRTYNKEHPDVKRGAKRIEIFESAIKEILN